MLNKVSNDRQEVEKSWKLPQLTQDLIEITQKDHLSRGEVMEAHILQRKQGGLGPI